ncbi:hypothetical protein BCR33DRAFT_745260 [Rhizoclosmatium globosum]|uniref:Uncharacterized protein n=1 Tax=Rhizoclosmatium globosum TaxID=329046 RepID=A0A1Y2B3W7_9FUNG|nr:hypothetical protein BCR33DRAFT_745260 [Rhizoclosmatium globosum]|eukprot:ORY29416.1 hypothetical protein BCR33DRAFT_745260 [Rhizoclosmatium globosum]
MEVTTYIELKDVYEQELIEAFNTDDANDANKGIVARVHMYRYDADTGKHTTDTIALLKPATSPNKPPNSPTQNPREKKSPSKPENSGTPAEQTLAEMKRMGEALNETFNGFTPQQLRGVIREIPKRVRKITKSLESATGMVIKADLLKVTPRFLEKMELSRDEPDGLKKEVL